MLQRALLVLFFLIILLVVIAWLLGGAAKDIVSKAGQFGDPFTALFSGTVSSTTPSFLYFPQPHTAYIPLPDGTSYTSESISAGKGDAQTQGEIQDELDSLDSEYDTLSKRVEQAKTFGEPSPYKDRVRLSQTGSPKETDPSLEYVEIDAIGNTIGSNTTPIDITGWSIQSVVSGVRVFVPRAAPVFLQGQVSTLSDVYLDPSSSAIVTTGVSPVGASFRENMCSGYLSQFQTFEPDVQQNCPAPSEELPQTAENIKTYGQDCIDFVSTLDTCRFYVKPITEPVSQACVAFVQQALSYSGCVARNRWRARFSENNWRVYLNSPSELWQNKHDVLRLLDREGRTVSVWGY